MALWTVGLSALGAAISSVFLANTDLWMSKPESASLTELAAADLRSLDQGFWKSGDLPVFLTMTPVGCGVQLQLLTGQIRELGVQRIIPDARTSQEAAELSSLTPQLDELGVPLYAVIKENIENEVKDFQPYFKGKIFLDVNKCFYGPKQRMLGLMGFARLGVWRNFIRAWRKGFTGNTDGEGFILGGVFVIGPGEQGILLEHREKEFGDAVDCTSLLEAVGRIKPRKETKSEP